MTIDKLKIEKQLQRLGSYVGNLRDLNKKDKTERMLKICHYLKSLNDICPQIEHPKISGTSIQVAKSGSNTSSSEILLGEALRLHRSPSGSENKTFDNKNNHSIEPLTAENNDEVESGGKQVNSSQRK